MGAPAHVLHHQGHAQYPLVHACMCFFMCVSAQVPLKIPYGRKLWQEIEGPPQASPPIIMRMWVAQACMGQKGLLCLA